MTLRDSLIACGAVRFGDFTLASGAKSPYYVDIKRASTDPKILREIGEGMGSTASRYDLVAGMELGAVPIAVAASLASGVPFLIVRKKAKEHGTGSRIEGTFARGQRVLVVEDVTTTGGSSLQAVEVLRSEGLVVDTVLTVVDREQGAAAAFAKVGVKLEALVRASELLRAAPKK
jgi:orotate phosphoribosyltransferase